jgi:hypothetical protein
MRAELSGNLVDLWLLGNLFGVRAADLVSCAVTADL